MLRRCRRRVDGLSPGRGSVLSGQGVVGRRTVAPGGGFDGRGSNPGAALLRRVRRAITSKTRPAAERLRETRQSLMSDGGRRLAAAAVVLRNYGKTGAQACRFETIAPVNRSLSLSLSLSLCCSCLFYSNFFCSYVFSNLPCAFHNCCGEPVSSVGLLVM